MSEAAKKLQLSHSKDASAEEKLAAYESGEKPPSRLLLVKMSKRYRRPLLTFYLEAPADRGEDFRTLPNAIDPSQNAIVDALFRNIKARQEIIRDALISEGDQTPLEFVGSYNLDQGVHGLVNLIKHRVTIDLEEYRSKRTQEDAFRYLRDRVEHLGIFSILAGNLGSHHTNLSTDVFRGFAIADSVAPFVVINDQDAKSAWPVTLLHEVAHIWLGTTGISGSIAERKVERFCDKVASELLVPEEEIEGRFPYDELADFNSAVRAIDQFASARKVSSRLVSFRLLTQTAISAEMYNALSKHFLVRWREEKERQKQRAKDTDSGPSYYALKHMRVGSALIEASERLMRSGELSTTQAATVLGVRAIKVGNLLTQSRAA
ncbi:MAG: ImmA/IrrE family metallo-endopeptidase [Methylomonas sp.]